MHAIVYIVTYEYLIDIADDLINVVMSWSMFAKQSEPHVIAFSLLKFFITCG